MKSLLKVILLLPMFLQGCGTWSGGPLDGQVLEAKTRRPIPDAFVSVAWDGRLSSWVHSTHVCYHVALARTDSNGRFHIPRWSKPATLDYVSDKSSGVMTVYKPGWRSYLTDEIARSEEHQKHNVMFVEPDTSDRESRFRYLESSVGGSGKNCSAGESTKSVLPMLEAIYEEEKKIAVTEDEKKGVNSTLFSIDVIRYGLDKATERMSARVKNMEDGSR